MWVIAQLISVIKFICGKFWLTSWIVKTHIATCVPNKKLRKELKSEILSKGMIEDDITLFSARLILSFSVGF